jgi:hypothetical protein
MSKAKILQFAREWAVTIVAFVLALTLVLTAALTDFDFIKLNLSLLNGIEKNQIDDVLVGFGILFAAVTVDRSLSQRRKRRQVEMTEARLRVLKATMRTVQDIVNNFLNNTQQFRWEAEKALPEATLSALDDLIF